MIGPIQVFSRSPSECSENEIKDFMALVLAGGEVAAKGFQNRVSSAVSLVFLTIGCCLCGVAALKRPEASYRKRVSCSSDRLLTEQAFPYELGWVFVMPSARGHKFSVDLTREALAGAGTHGVFATSRTDNVVMHATLKKFDVLPVGRPWNSRHGDHELQLFVRAGAAS